MSTTMLILKLMQYMPQELVELILQYSYVDTYKDHQNKNFRSLVFRRNFIWCSMSNGCFNGDQPKRSKIPGNIAALVSEYSLLPPSAEFDCQEEEQYEHLLISGSGNTQIVEEEFLNNLWHKRISDVYYKWNRTHYLQTRCRLSLTMLFDNHHNDNKTIKNFDTMDPSDVTYYNCFTEELNVAHLEAASLSFYYREFLAGHCQCSFASCLGKKRLT